MIRLAKSTSGGLVAGLPLNSRICQTRHSDTHTFSENVGIHLWSVVLDVVRSIGQALDRRHGVYKHLGLGGTAPVGLW